MHPAANHLEYQVEVPIMARNGPPLSHIMNRPQFTKHSEAIKLATSGGVS